ncbi:hypothetical protein [Yinghuangia sp. YIM S10712]|uniref:hypothetical protein n=1 Tax=Yinghuangia sp. YIM S10712 TaxID=3436930 RepID=UPI003F53E1F2
MADASIPLHVLRVIAGHGSLTTTQRYLHPNQRTMQNTGTTLAEHLTETDPDHQRPEQPAAVAEPPRLKGHLRLVQ